MEAQEAPPLPRARQILTICAYFPLVAELAQMKLPELKALAAKRGITPNGDKRYKDTYIDALL